MEHQEILDYANTLRDLADFLSDNADKVPDDTWFYGLEISLWLTESDYEYYTDDEGKRKTNVTFNEAKTKKKVKDFLNFVGSCEKEYLGDTLEITKKFGKHKIIGNVDRSVTCKKIVTGTEVVPERVTPEYVREITEWDCSDIPSLLALIKE